MEIWQAIILGVIEGITEFLPVSSTGHLTIAEKLLGLPVDDPAITGFTAVIQIGAIAAVFVFLYRDILWLTKAWLRGLVSARHRQTRDYRLGWFVIFGSLPIGIVGYAAQGLIKGSLRSLWVVAASLIAWSFVMLFAEHSARKAASHKKVNFLDAMVIGLAQCLALVPGVSRSGATIATGLMRGISRVSATRLSFGLSIPALTAAGIYELPDALSSDIGIAPLIVGTLVSFAVAYVSVAWLLKFVAHHTLDAFSWYRIALGLLLALALGFGWVAAT
ncbi:MAG: undecaprenyl-diphosphate phosphatase [Gaiellales bacterium]|nr:MAG: undecaprenyl-diphosphate phosphatase [Gaiellales bacterium]